MAFPVRGQYLANDFRILMIHDVASLNTFISKHRTAFMFELGSPVGDVKWAPYSSTVFAACTADGKVYVYDLNVNKYRPVCVQAVVSKKAKKLTRIDFNQKLPVIVCGDTKYMPCTKIVTKFTGYVQTPKKAQGVNQRTLQIMKLDKLLSLVRDPPFTPGIVDEKFDED